MMGPISWVLVLLGCMLALGGLICLVLIPEEYEACARIEIDKHALWPEGNPENQVRSSFWVPSEIEMIQSKVVLHAVITNLNEHRSWAGGTRREQPIEQTYQWLKERVMVRQTPNTSLFEIRVHSADPFEAMRIANAVAQTFRQSRLDRARELAEGGLRVLGTEAGNLEEQLRAKQAEIESLKANTADARSVAMAQRD